MNEGEPKRRAVGLTIIIGGVLIAAAIITLYTPWLGVFNLRVIVVRGNHHVTPEEIKRVSGLGNGGPLARLPVHRAAVALETIPWVKQATVTRIYPHTVRITIQERTPIAAIAVGNGNYLIIGDGGVVVEKQHLNQLPYPLVIGAPLTQATAGGRIQNTQIIAILARLHSARLVPKPFNKINFSDPAAVQITSLDGTVVQLGELSGIEARIDELIALLPTIDLARYRSIDLRFGGEAILVPRKVVNR